FAGRGRPGGIVSEAALTPGGGPPGVRSELGLKHTLVREQLRRILAHPSFKRSERLCRFLQFVVDRALEGKGQDVKEYTIGLHVFDKDASFDPRTDPIVRVEAGRLRQRLAEYYASHPSDRILILLRQRG